MTQLKVVRTAVERDPVAIHAAPPLVLKSQGTSFPFDWRPIAGATGARIGGATVDVDPATGGDGRELGVVVGARSGQSELRVRSPEPGNRIRSISIANLVARRDDGSEATLRSESDLTALGLRLVVAAVMAGSVQAPMASVRALPSRGAVPRTLTGASFRGSVLTVPDLVGDEVSVTLCKNDSPEDFEPRPFSHGDVSVAAAPGPTGVHVLGPAGDEVYAFAGPLLDTVRADVRAALERHLAEAVTGAAHQATVTVSADLQGGAQVDFNVSGVVIERRVPERIVVRSLGDPVVLDPALPPPGRAPSRTVADVTVTHLGLRLHPLSDRVATQSQPLAGVVVWDREVVRVLADRALAGQRLRRVAVIGRPLRDCDLRLEVLGTVATAKGVSAGGPGTAQVVWFDLGEDLAVEGGVRIGLTATRGAFGWAGAEPAVRFAVVVDPVGTSVQVAGLAVTVVGGETFVPGAQLTGLDPWPVSTDQFCEVALANVVQEFAP